MKHIKIVFNVILLLIFTSCVSTTTIKALDKKGQIDKDVKIYVDYKLIGNGEGNYSDKKSVFSPIPILEYKKEGCKNQKQNLNLKYKLFNYLGGAALSGAGIGILSVDKAKVPNAFMFGFPIGVLGFLMMTWGREYVPLHQTDFQCEKIE